MRYGAGISLVAVASKLVVLWLRVQRMKRVLADVPYARYKRSMLLGFWKDLLANRHRMHDWRQEISQGLPVSKLCGLPPDPNSVIVIVRDPLLVRHFLKDNFENYTKPPPTRNHFWHYLNEWLGCGLFTVMHGVASQDGGHSWMKQRKISSAIFSRANFNNNMQAVFVTKAKRLQEVLVAPAGLGEKVDMQQHFFSFTMDSIMQIFFGEHADTMGGAVSCYGSAYDTAHKCMVEHTVASALPNKLASLLPWPVGGHRGLFRRIYDFRSPAHRGFREACRVLDSESERLVRACRADPKLPERTDLLALFVKCEDQERFSTKFLRDVVLNFIIAGRDTTACTLTWMFYILATHPTVQEALCKEIDDKFPRGCSAPTLKQVSASEMPYLNGVLYETLRLHPPVPIDAKYTARDDVLPDGSHVPGGINLLFLPYAMGRDASTYEDPLEVKPERWIPFAEPLPHEFPVFQAGPRICLGKDMAIFEAKLASCMLLQEYTFELAPGEAEKITYNNTLTMSLCNSKQQDSHNLWLIPKRRL